MKNLSLISAVILFTFILLTCKKSESYSNQSSNKEANKSHLPVISRIFPVSAEIGDTLTILGSNFNQSQDSGYVSVKGIKATVYLSWSNNLIKVLIPSGSVIGTGKVSVNVNRKMSNEVNFNLLQSSPVVIGTQTWMGYNLDVDHYRDGTPIPEVQNPAAWARLRTGAWCYYNNDPAFGAIYGKLYNWYAVNDPRGLAPAGWHIPTDDEWKELSLFLGMTQEETEQYGFAWFGTTEGGKIKEEGTNLWFGPNAGATNESGFTALPASMRSVVSEYGFGESRGSTFWWSATEYNGGAWVRGLDNELASIYRNCLYKGLGFSVRCIKDN